MRSTVAGFALASLVALALLVGGGIVVLREVGRREAVDNARRSAALVGQGIVEPELTDALLAGRADAVARMDRVVQERVLGDRIARVKLWTPGGRIVYSDEPRLIGARYALGAGERATLRTGDPQARESDLSRPENRYERAEGHLLEVYLPVRTPSGRQLLFEAYQREDSITSSGRQLWLAFAPIALGALILLWLVQVPLAWSLARRLKRGQEDREGLMGHALEASAVERRRIAGDLHDGVVQDLAGLSYRLAAAAGKADAAADPEAADALRGGAAGTREGVRRLRSLVVDLHPANLHAEGLAAALEDLAAPLRADGLEVRVDAGAGLELDPEAETLLYRGAREALRNVAAHAGAARVTVRAATADGVARLVVEDDGRGFDAGERERRRTEGHLGLDLLGELAEGQGGALRVRSEPGRGTRVELEVPAR